MYYSKLIFIIINLLFLGSNYGTISHQYPLKESQHEESEPEKLLENEEKELSKHLRNFYTSPPKIGGYGYVEGCIGKPYEYISSPYNREQELNAHARLMSKKKNVTVTPFIGSSHETPCFDPNPFKGLTPFIIAPKPKVDLPSITWKPNAGCSSFLNPFPEYKPPYPQPSKVELQSQIREKLQLRKTQTMTDLKFKPVGATCHSYPIKSLIQMNIPKSPSAHVRSMIKTLKQSK
ncbi:hypothetical protein HMI56_007494 [Coelomomyces lativittatus]|nr:hypothetical protein HMI56_007494 [Coelomomyces lativittatus]